jgi:selenocysteine lyase/cysteine desulfurase
MDITKIREDFPITEQYIYLNHAAVSPLPLPVLDAVSKYYESRKFGNLFFKEWYKVADETKKLVAKLLNAKASEIALVSSTSEGVNIAANMLGLKGNDEVILNDLEFPTNTYPWMRFKYKMLRSRDGRIELEDFKKAMNKNTKVVALSHVSYKNGFTHDIEAIGELCEERDIYFFVDAIQSMGLLDIDVEKAKIDFLSSGAYKWQLGPSGIGVFYIRRELAGEFEPPYIGWKSAREPFAFKLEYEPAEGAEKFEIGTPCHASIYGYNAALKYLLSFGIDYIRERVLSLTQILHDSIDSKLTPENTSGIFSFKFKGDIPPKFVVTKKDYVRVSPHFYNTEEEIKEFVEAVKWR